MTQSGKPMRLGMRLVRLAHAAWTQASLAPIARPHLERSAELGRSRASGPDRPWPGVVRRQTQRQQPFEMLAPSRQVGPAYCTGVGKAMLAHLSDDDTRGLRATGIPPLYGTTLTRR